MKTCPLCEEDTLKNFTVPTPKNINHKEIAIWVCKSCPFVGFEYWDKHDTEAMAKYLQEN